MSDVAAALPFTRYQQYSVPVAAGDLAVLRWPATDPGTADPRAAAAGSASASAAGPGGTGPVASDPAGPPVLLIHGITANALAWAGVVEAVAGRLDLIAPDLRGRAGSREVGGPYGIDRDVEDMIAVLDDAGIERAVVAGHSLGGFVACALARQHPDRVARVVAVDGGLGFPVPADLDPDRVLEAVVGPAIAKLAMTFDDVDAYLDFHRNHPSFVGNWTPQLTAYLHRDALPVDGRIVSSCIESAIRADGRQVLVDDDVRDAITSLDCPVTLLYAERGMVNEPQALYDEQRLAAAALDPAQVRTRLVPGTNHYTIVAPGAGAQAVAAQVLATP